MKCSVFTGCSYTEGIGLEEQSQDPNLWVNRLHGSTSANTKLINLGKSGATNHEIFQNSILALTHYPCENLFVAWTELLRFKINPGVELYPTSIFWSLAAESKDVAVNPSVLYSKNYLNNVKNRFFLLRHTHYELVDILKYTNIINRICNQLGVRAFFINSLIIDYDNGYFDHKDICVPSDTTTLTQIHLNASTRDDQEFIQLYHKIHNDYADTGGLPPVCTWLNLYQSFRLNFYMDQGTDNLHPGPKSHRAFADWLIQNFSNKPQAA